ncbi:MAG: hypothetical protein HFJ41_04395 [Clostridia bacterium]|nr:hypothetical protein [Clostridia bacterium]
MKKGLKNFLLVCVVALLCFIFSFVIQYYIAVETTIRIMVAIAMWCAVLGAILVVLIMYMSSNLEKGSSISIYILWILMIFVTISMVFFLSTLGNPMINNVGLICFCVSFALFMIYILYLSIKEVIKAYKKCKENQ